MVGFGSSYKPEALEKAVVFRKLNSGLHFYFCTALRHCACFGVLYEAARLILFVIGPGDG